MVAALELLFPTLWDGLPAVIAVLELHLAAWLAGPSAFFETTLGEEPNGCGSWA